MCLIYVWDVCIYFCALCIFIYEYDVCVCVFVCLYLYVSKSIHPRVLKGKLLLPLTLCSLLLSL